MWHPTHEKHAARMRRRFQRQERQKAAEALKQLGKESIETVQAIIDQNPNRARRRKLLQRFFEEIRQAKNQAAGKQPFENFQGDLFKCNTD